MFKSMISRAASDLTGLSDNCKVINPSEFDKCDAAPYVFSDMGERIYFLLKSKKDEYAFTNIALIHVDGDKAISSKRVVKRYNYLDHTPHSIFIETAGTVDLDVEIKFTLGQSFSIDVVKSHLESLTALYKILILIGMTKQEHERHWALVERSFEHSRDAVGRLTSSGSASAEYRNILKHSREEFLAQYEQYHPQEFDAAFKMFLEE